LAFVLILQAEKGYRSGVRRQKVRVADSFRRQGFCRLKTVARELNQSDDDDTIARYYTRNPRNNMHITTAVVYAERRFHD